MSFFKEATAAGTGFISISALSPEGTVIDSIHHVVLSAAPWLSQGTVDEIGKILVVFVLTMVSRVATKYLEKKKQEAVPVTPPAAKPSVPETLTLNNNDNGEISKEVSSN